MPPWARLCIAQPRRGSAPLYMMFRIVASRLVIHRLECPPVCSLPVPASPRRGWRAGPLADEAPLPGASCKTSSSGVRPGCPPGVQAFHVGGRDEGCSRRA
jgi:hypothetical protein